LQQPVPSPQQTLPTEEKTEVVKTETTGETAKKEEDSEPAPKGNGGRTAKYVWTQTLEVTLPLPRMWNCSFSWIKA
jgi:hypothetical protein